MEQKHLSKFIVINIYKRAYDNLNTVHDNKQHIIKFSGCPWLCSWPKTSSKTFLVSIFRIHSWMIFFSSNMLSRFLMQSREFKAIFSLRNVNWWITRHFIWIICLCAILSVTHLTFYVYKRWWWSSQNVTSSHLSTALMINCRNNCTQFINSKHTN